MDPRMLDSDDPTQRWGCPRATPHYTRRVRFSRRNLWTLYIAGGRSATVVERCRFWVKITPHQHSEHFTVLPCWPLPLSVWRHCCSTVSLLCLPPYDSKIHRRRIERISCRGGAPASNPRRRCANRNRVNLAFGTSDGDWLRLRRAALNKHAYCIRKTGECQLAWSY